MGFFDIFRRPPPAEPPAAIVRRDTSAEWVPNVCAVATAGWGNPMTGLGYAGLDPTAALNYRGGIIPSSSTVDTLYTFDWLAARVIEKMPSVAMVRGWTSSAPDPVMTEFRRLNVSDRFPRGAFQRAVYDGRGYGGSVMLLGYRQGNPTQPLEGGQAAGGIEFLDLFGQHELRVLTRFSDPNRSDFGMPELYEVMGVGNGPRHPRFGQIFHSSRAIRFQGLPLRVPGAGLDAYLDTEGPELGISVLTPVMTTIGQYGLSWSAVSNILNDASIGVMKMGGLVEGLASEARDAIENRMKLLQSSMSSHRKLFLDADANEEYTRTEARMTDVPAILQQIMIAVAAAAETPASIFFSSSPTGLNANSKMEADLTQFYNTCQAYRRDYLGPKLETVLTAINGGRPVTVEWPSLWEASDNEQAQTRLAQANADKVFYDMGWSAEQISRARAKGTSVELLGETPADTRDEVAGAGAPDPGTGPQGAPDRKQAAEIATKQRAAQK